jgi:hypothetical protein
MDSFQRSRRIGTGLATTICWEERNRVKHHEDCISIFGRFASRWN